VTNFNNNCKIEEVIRYPDKHVLGIKVKIAAALFCAF